MARCGGARAGAEVCAAPSLPSTPGETKDLVSLSLSALLRFKAPAESGHQEHLYLGTLSLDFIMQQVPLPGVRPGLT